MDPAIGHKWNNTHSEIDAGGPQLTVLSDTRYKNSPVQHNNP